LRTGRSVGTGVAVLGVADPAARASGRHLSTVVGALGDALHGAGLHTAAVGRADLDPDRPVRPVALAVTDGSGVVDQDRYPLGRNPCLLHDECIGTARVLPVPQYQLDRSDCRRGAGRPVAARLEPGQGELSHGHGPVGRGRTGAGRAGNGRAVRERHCRCRQSHRRCGSSR